MQTLKTSKANWRPLISKSNHNTEYSTGLHASKATLERSGDGRFRLTHTVGPALDRPADEPIESREKAIEWVYANVTDPVTGYYYDREQCELIVDDKQPGRGWRDRNED